MLDQMKAPVLSASWARSMAIYAVLLTASSADCGIETCAVCGDGVIHGDLVVAFPSHHSEYLVFFPRSVHLDDDDDDDAAVSHGF